ncbi:hypothetical protein JCM8097_004446 [Rhodosporidiobolus ruineniae]
MKFTSLAYLLLGATALAAPLAQQPTTTPRGDARAIDRPGTRAYSSALAGPAGTDEQTAPDTQAVSGGGSGDETDNGIGENSLASSGLDGSSALASSPFADSASDGTNLATTPASVDGVTGDDIGAATGDLGGDDGSNAATDGGDCTEGERPANSTAPGCWTSSSSSSTPDDADLSELGLGGGNTQNAGLFGQLGSFAGSGGISGGGLDGGLGA